MNDGDLRARLAALGDLVPILDAPDPDFGHWELPAARGEQHSLGWYEFGPAGQQFLDAVATGAWVEIGFDWRTWLATDEGRALKDEPTAVDRATPDQLSRLLTAIVRSDRFVEGSIAGAFESGLLLRIARRAAALLAGNGPVGPAVGATPPD